MYFFNKLGFLLIIHCPLIYFFLTEWQKKKSAENKIRLGKISLKMQCAIMDWTLGTENRTAVENGGNHNEAQT